MINLNHFKSFQTVKIQYKRYVKLNNCYKIKTLDINDKDI
jgi:hypothetical protein